MSRTDDRQVAHDRGKLRNSAEDRKAPGSLERLRERFLRQALAYGRIESASEVEG